MVCYGIPGQRWNSDKIGEYIKFLEEQHAKMEYRIERLEEQLRKTRECNERLEAMLYNEIEGPKEVDRELRQILGIEVLVY